MQTELYSFVFKGVLTDASLDKVGRRRRSHFGREEARLLQTSLCYDLLDVDHLAEAQRMAVVYAAIHSFENMVRDLVTKAMTEAHGAQWWEKVPDRIQKMAKSRMEEEGKFKWHGSRGTAEINYCDFGDLSSVIVTNWPVFEDVVGDMEWAKAVLNTLEKSRNIIMHGGVLAKEDVERIGMNIRDWIRQTG
ncbi:MAG: Swt1 family HEPN domain-containing protein [Limisphaerales bacterium]